MTPSMELSDLIRLYADHPDRERIARDLHKAMTLGHKFGLNRAANALTGRKYQTAKQIVKFLKVADEIKEASVIEDDFT